MRALVLSTAATLLLGSAIAAQEPKSDAYLLQLAAAVSGYSGGGPVYIVICTTDGEYDVIGGFATAAQAQESANANRGPRTSCDVEGPLKNSTEYGFTDRLMMQYGGGCKKGPDSDCAADSTRAILQALGNIQTVTLTYRLRDGRTLSESFDPRRVEAVFFTMSAVDRMLIPYYARVYGMTGAAQRRRVLAGVYGVPVRER